MDSPTDLHRQLDGLDPSDLTYATRVVDLILEHARKSGATDVHLRPTTQGLEWRWRLDGVLHPVTVLPAQVASNIVARLKVLADLLTYRNDFPQEGRIRLSGDSPEMRLSTFPTLHGEKAVIRLFASAGELLFVDDLGLAAEDAARVKRLLTETSGAMVVAGPAGSGKTTTLYACLREIGRASAGRSLASLEDPVEVEVPGVAQSQVAEPSGFDLSTGLRFLLRQDPEVIMVSEVRDRSTAETVVQAALTGHLVLTTFHAGSAAAAINRLSEMGIEPYVLRSGILAILSQRLVRRLCTCAKPSEREEDRLGFQIESVHVPAGCPLCQQTGYHGRALLAELLTIDSPELGRAVLARDDAMALEQMARAAGMRTLADRARDAIATGVTSPAEVRRVFGFSDHLRATPL